MALIGNYSIINRTPIRQFATGVSSQYATTITPPSAVKNRFYGGIPKIAATPNGYLAPSAWVLPMTGGGLASYQQLNESIVTSNAALYSGINIDSAISGSIVITQAILDQIVGLVAAITGSIVTTDAQLAAVSEMIAAITATMTVTDAQIGAIIDMIAALSGSIITTNAGNFSTAEISADMSLVTAAATPADISTELLDNQDIETGYSLRESLRLMLSAMAGQVSGAPGASITIRDINDTVDRIVAAVDVNGNRTFVAKNVT